MDEKWIGGITDAGSRLLEQSINGNAVSITSVTVGSDTAPPEELSKQTALINEVQDGSIVSDKALDIGRKICVEFHSDDKTYTANQIGFWGQAGDDGERTLVAIFQFEHGIVIHSRQDAPEFSFTFYAVIEVSKEAKLTISIDHSAVVTQGELESSLREAIDGHNGNKDAHAGVLAKVDDLKKKADLDDGGKLKKTQLPELATSDVTGLDNALKNVPAGNVQFTDGETFQQKFDAGKLTGPPGADGPTGPAGPQGEPGPKTDSIDLVLAADGWVENQQIASDEQLVLSGYNYIVGAAATSEENMTAFNDANIRGLDMSGDGQVTFICDEPPTQDVTVRLFRIAANEEGA